MTVGGWFDGRFEIFLHIYKTIEKNNPKAKNSIVMVFFMVDGLMKWGNIFS